MIQTQLQILFDIFTSISKDYHIGIVCSDINELEKIKNYIRHNLPNVNEDNHKTWSLFTLNHNRLHLVTIDNAVKAGRFDIGICSKNIEQIIYQELIVPLFNLNFSCAQFNPEELEELNEN